MLRPFTQEELVDLANQGYDVSQYDGRAMEFPDPPPTSALAAGARSAVASAIPTIAGGAGFAGGMAAGAAAGGAMGLAGGPAALISVPAGLVAGGVAGYLAGKAQQAVLPDSVNQQLALDQQQHPIATTVGSLATLPLGGMSPSTAGPKAIATAIARRSVNPQEIGIAARQALVNSGIGASLGAIQTGVEEKLRGEELNPAAIAGSAALGTVLTRPNAIGKLYGFHDLPSRTLDSKDAFRAQLQSSAGQVVEPDRQPVVRIPIQGPELPEVPKQIARAPKIDPSSMTDAEVKAKLIELGRPAAYVEKIAPDFARRMLAEGMKAQSADDTKTPLTLEIAEKLKQAELQGMSPEYIQTLRDELLAPHQIRLAPDKNLGGKTPAKGEALVSKGGQRVVKINSGETGFSADTIPHEDFHHAYADWQAKAANGDVQAAKDLAHLQRLSKPGLDAINLKRAEAGKKLWDMEEFIVSEQGNEFLKQQLDLDNETGRTGWTKWVNDTKALLATRGENPTLEQARRAANFRRVNEVTEGGKAPQFGPPRNQDDEGQQTEDFTRYNNLVNSLKGKSLTEAVSIATEIEQIKNKYGGKPPTLPLERNEQIRQDQQDEIKQLYGRSQGDKEGLDVERIVLAAAKTTDPYKQWKLKQARAGLPTDDDAFRDALSKDAELQADMDTEPAFTAAIQQSVAEQQKLQDKQVEAPIEVPKVSPAERAQRALRPGQRSEQQIYDDRIAEQQQREARQAAERLAKEKPPTMEEVKARNKALLKQLGIDTTADQLDAEREVARVVARTTASKVQGPQTWEEARPQWAKEVAASDAAKIRDAKRKAIEESNKYIAQRKREGRFQEDDEGLTIRSIKLLSNPKAAKLPFNNANAANGDQLLGSLRNQLAPAEYDMLKQEGIEKAWGGKIVNQQDALEWVKKNGPKVKVESYGMEGKVSEAKKEYDKMTHEWYDLLPSKMRTIIEVIKRSDQDYDNAWKTYAPPEYEQYKEKARRYVELRNKTMNEPEDTTPKATSYYNTVSALPTNEPMPEWTATKSGQNVQRVDVVIPAERADVAKMREKHQNYSDRMDKGEKLTDAEQADYEKNLNELGKHKNPYLNNHLWQPDNLHENLPNTLGWAMIQYKTGPKGEKIAVIAEAQSRWGQYVRDKKIEQDLEQYGGPTATQRAEAKNKINHPLLRDYNRLILKAAIEQARKEGATHIVVSDAETAMMTEGHDIYALPKVVEVHKNLSGYEQNKKWLELNDKYKDRERYSVEIVKDGVRVLDNSNEVPEQEPGMRLNYDNILPKIAEELTGSKGERVSLGEHKNAMENAVSEQYPRLRNEHKTPRQNLIFRNPDGTPKTDVSGVMYDIRPVSERLAKGDKFTLFNKYQGEGEGLDPWVNKEQNKPLDLTGLNKKIDADFEKYDKLGIAPPRDELRTVDQVSQMNEDLHTGKDWSRNQEEGEGQKIANTESQREAIRSYLKDNIDSIAKEMDEKWTTANNLDNWNKKNGWAFKSTIGEYVSKNALDEHPMAGDLMLNFIKPFVNESKFARIKDVVETARKALGYENMQFNEDLAAKMAEEKRASYYAKRYQGEDEGLRANDMSKQGLWRGASSAFDRVREVSIPLSEAFKRWEAYRDKIWGHAQTSISDLQALDKKAVDKAFTLHREIFRHAKESEVEAKLRAINSGGGEVAKASRLLTQYYHDKIGNIRRELGYRHDGRLAGLNKSYVPDVLNDRVLDIFVNKSQSPEAEQLKTAWVNHVLKESKGELKLNDVRNNINEYIDALGGSRNQYKAVEFGALRKAEGYGLPDSMRETDAVKALSKYGRRAANDMAMFKELEMNSRVANALKLRNPITGEFHKGYDESTTLNQATQIKDAMKWVTGNFSSTMSRSTPQIQSAVRVVNNALLGTATGLRDTVSIPMNAIPYITSFADLQAFIRGVSNFRKEARNALETAAKQPNLDKLQFDTLTDAPDKFSHFANTLATMLRRYQGREALENFNRDVTFAAGKELAKQWIIGAKAGHKGSVEMLKKFDTLVDGDVTKMSGKKLEEALNQMGKNFTDRNQGTYGGRGLPNWMIDSPFAPFFALQKWSIEKSNVIYKDVVKPAVERKNFIPLLTYTAGSLLTGAAIQQLNELLTNRKAQDPTIKEALEKGTPHALASELATIMQLGSFMGIVGDGMKFISDATHGKTPRNIVSFPTATFAADTGERTMQMIEAIKQGENPFDVISQWSIDLMVKNIQMARMLANHTVNEKNVERSDKFRDMRVFNELEGKPAAAIATTNPYLNYQAKQFKQTSDAQEAYSMLPELLSSARSKAGQDYEKLSSNLRGLKANSYQTMPSPERQPLGFQRYYQYLVATQGKEAADARLKDYMRQSRVNTLKASLVPSL